MIGFWISESFEYMGGGLNLLSLHRVFNKILHLIYLAGPWICFDFTIYQSCEYNRVLNMPRLHYVLNKIFHNRCSTVLWICFGFWICQGLNMPALHMVLNKILHSIYLGGFWIFLKFWICQFYTGFRRKRPTIFLGFSTC